MSYGRAQGQLAYYRLQERRGVIRIVESLATLRAHIAEWRAWETGGASGSRRRSASSSRWRERTRSSDRTNVAGWWADGLRIVSLCHYGLSAYAHGTGQPGGLTDRGKPCCGRSRRPG